MYSAARPSSIFSASAVWPVHHVSVTGALASTEVAADGEPDVVVEPPDEHAASPSVKTAADATRAERMDLGEVKVGMNAGRWVVMKGSHLGDFVGQRNGLVLWAYPD